jgi:hypothetical protein
MFGLTLAIGFLTAGCPGSDPEAERDAGSGGWSRVPYDRTNPVIYDNDVSLDVYTGEFLAVLNSAGDISLRGIVKTLVPAPFNPYMTPAVVQAAQDGWAAQVAIEEASGLRNRVSPVNGADSHLTRPASGSIEETTATASPGSSLIIEQALAAASGKPLVVIVGGSLTTVASAYLLSPAIADRIVVGFLGCFDSRDCREFNVWADPWAAYVVFERLRTVIFPASGSSGMPVVPKSRLTELPPTPLRQYMIEKTWAAGGAPQFPGVLDIDTPPAIALMRADYPTSVTRASVAGWAVTDGYPLNREVPMLRPSRTGALIVVSKASGRIATDEWLRAFRNPVAYGPSAS